MGKIFILAFLTAISLFSEENGNYYSPYLCLETGFHNGSIQAVAATPDGGILVSTGLDGTIRTWRLDGKILVADKVLRIPTAPGQGGELYGVSISADGKWIIAGGNTTTINGDSYCIYIIDRALMEINKVIEGIDSPIANLRLNKAGVRVLACLQATGVRCYEIPSGKLLWQDANYGFPCADGCWLSDGGCVTTNMSGMLNRYNAQGKRIASEHILSLNNGIGGVAYNDKDQIMTGLLYTPAVSVLTQDLEDVQAQSDFARNFASIIKNDRGLGGLASVAWSGGWWAAGTYHIGNEYCVFSCGELPKKFGGLSRPITDMVGFGNKRVLVATQNPSLGIIDASDGWIARTDANSFNFQSPNGSLNSLMVNADATSICIGSEYTGENPLYLHIKSGEVTTSIKGSPPMHGALQVALGLKISGLSRDDLPVNAARRASIAIPGLYINDQLIFPDEEDTCSAFAFLPNGKGAVLCCKNSLRLVTKSAGGSKMIDLWEVPLTNPCAVNVSEDGRIIVAASADGIIHWYQASDGSELLNCYINRDLKWIIWTPSGYYHCSNGAETLIGWRVNIRADKLSKFYDISRFSEKFNRPDIVLKALEIGISALGESAPTGKKAAMGIPDVKITSPKNGDVLPPATESVKIFATILDTGAGIDEIIITNNGKVMPSASRAGTRGESGEYSWNVPVSFGENRIQLSAFNGLRTESYPSEIVLNVQGRAATTELFGIALAVAEYENPKYTLTWPTTDADAVVEEFEAGAKPLYKAMHWKKIYNKSSSRAEIQSAFEEIQKKAKPQDTFIFYYAGHGVISSGSPNERGKYYLVTPSITQMYGQDDALVARAVSADDIRDWCQKIQAQKQLLLIDACHSAAAIDPFTERGSSEEASLAQLSRSTGASIIVAAGRDERATEQKELGHGIFTYSLINGLRGGAKASDGIVTIRGLDAWLARDVPELTLRFHAQKQIPASFNKGNDFPLTVPKPGR